MCHGAVALQIEDYKSQQVNPVMIPLSMLSSSFRITLHDGFSDPLRWRSGSQSLTPRDFNAKTIRERVSQTPSPVTIVLDSLSWILSRCPLPSVCHTLRELSRPPINGGEEMADCPSSSTLHALICRWGCVWKQRSLCRGLTHHL